MRIYIYMHTHTYIYAHKRKHIVIHIHIHTYTHTYVHVHMYIQAAYRATPMLENMHARIRALGMCHSLVTVRVPKTVSERTQTKATFLQFTVKLHVSARNTCRRMHT